MHGSLDDLMSHLSVMSRGELIETLRCVLAGFHGATLNLTFLTRPAFRSEEEAFLLDVIAATDPIVDGQDVAEAGSAQSLRQRIGALRAEVPELQPSIDAAIEEAAGKGPERLEVISDFAVALLVIAVASAILRPRITLERQTRQDVQATKVIVDVRGVGDLGAILRELFSYLPRQ